MKNLLTTLILCLSFIAVAQEDLTLTEDLTVTTGQDLTYNTLDLNGFDVELRNNSSLTVVNLLGPGNISATSNGNGNNQPILNVTGFIDCDNLTFDGQQAFASESQFTPCSDLSVGEPTLNIRELPMGVSYQVILFTGQIIRTGVTDSNTISELPKNQIFILKVKGFRPIKQYMN